MRNKMTKFLRILFIPLILLTTTYDVKAQDKENGNENSNEASVSEKGHSYETFVNDIGNQIIGILVDRNSPMEDRRERFRQILKSVFEIKSIGKFVMARYWRTMNDEQKAEFLKLFEDALVENYSAQFDNYNNEKLSVLSSHETKDGGKIVQSQIVRPKGGEPLSVDWKVFDTKNGMKIYDLIVNGVSLSITQRSLYASTIQNNNGSIDALLTSMRDKDFHKKLNNSTNVNNS